MVYFPPEMGSSDFCGFGELDPELIFRSLLGCDTNDRKVVLRVCMGIGVVTTPVHCGSFEDFLLNLRRSLEMAEDGQIAIRLNYDTYPEGMGLSICDTCAMGMNWQDYANSIFGEDSNGLVWVNIGIVCGDRKDT